MSTEIFWVNNANKTLHFLDRKSMSGAGFTEPRDLETWLADSNIELFGRSILWIARQDSPSDGQRSDLLGIDKFGNLIIAELKRGVVSEDAVTQVLSYSAEYANKTADDLASDYARHSAKEGQAGLVKTVSSVENAQQSINDHVGSGTEINESQIILLIGEDFSAKTLSVCDYLNNSSGEASFSLECWKYSLFEHKENNYYFLLEQILPPPSIRQAIDEKREASKAKKYARDPNKIHFMRQLIAYLKENQFSVTRSSGASYECKIQQNANTIVLSIHDNHPRVMVGDIWQSLYDKLAGQKDFKITYDKNSSALTIDNIDTSVFNQQTGECFIKLLKIINSSTI